MRAHVVIHVALHRLKPGDARPSERQMVGGTDATNRVGGDAQIGERFEPLRQDFRVIPALESLKQFPA